MTTNEDFWDSAFTGLHKIQNPTNAGQRDLDDPKFDKLRGLFSEMDKAVFAVLLAIQRIESEEPDA